MKKNKKNKKTDWLTALIYLSVAGLALTIILVGIMLIISRIERTNQINRIISNSSQKPPVGMGR